MQRENLKPYAEWLQIGRIVRSGQKAPYYLISPDGSHGVALFDVEQTQPYVSVDTTGWDEIVTRVEWKARNLHGPRIKVKRWGDGLAVWVGANKEAIKLMQQKGWHFDRYSNRWVHEDRSLEKFTAAMQAAGYEVVVE